MKNILIGMVILGSAVAQADVRWKLGGTAEPLAKIVSLTVDSAGLHVSDGNRIYSFPSGVIKAASLSVKDLLDLLKGNTVSGGTRLTITAKVSGKNGKTIESIDSLQVSILEEEGRP